MGIAALVLGIISIISSLIPGCGFIIALLPALIGLILGIVDVVKKSKSGESKGAGIAGIILTALALIISIVNLLFSAVIVGTAIGETTSNSSYYNSIYDSSYSYDYYNY